MSRISNKKNDVIIKPSNVLIVSSALLAINVITLGQRILGMESMIDTPVVYAMHLPEEPAVLESIPMVVEETTDTIGTPLLLSSDVSYEQSEYVNTLTMSGVECKNIKGETITTNTISINMDNLTQLSNSYETYPEWDVKGKIETIAILWEFLVNQQGVPAGNASGILGNIYVEGNFAEQQKTNLYISSIEQARTLLGSGDVGYGCAQWTHHSRQSTLLKYYETAYTLFPNDWESVVIAAECCMLLEECKAYEVFDDIYTPTAIEDATGRVAVIYESYSGCNEQWSSSNNVYRLVSNNGSGHERLAYAYAIYDYFME